MTAFMRAGELALKLPQDDIDIGMATLKAMVDDTFLTSERTWKTTYELPKEFAGTEYILR